MNTSQWFKYFRGSDFYNTWDSSQYRQNNSKDGKWLNHIFSIIFLNPEEVGERFVEDFIGTMPSGEKYQQFAEYLMEKYIDSNRPSFGRLAADNRCLRVFSLTLRISKYKFT